MKPIPKQNPSRRVWIIVGTGIAAALVVTYLYVRGSGPQPAQLQVQVNGSSLPQRIPLGQPYSVGVAGGTPGAPAGIWVTSSQGRPSGLPSLRGTFDLSGVYQLRSEAVDNPDTVYFWGGILINSQWQMAAGPVVVTFG